MLSLLKGPAIGESLILNFQMKKWFKIFFSLLNRIWLTFSIPASKKLNGLFFKVLIFSDKNNILIIEKSRVERSRLTIRGKKNYINIQSCSLGNMRINISGRNNKLILEEGVKFERGILIISGNNCEINIRKGSTFGGARIVNKGENNKVAINERCLFSDQIEIWASDTHSILNSEGAIINVEKPIYIGSHVWVGSRATILKGVTIGNNSVIGMGSIVTKDIPSNVIAAGNPARVLKEKINWSLY